MLGEKKDWKKGGKKKYVGLRETGENPRRQGTWKLKLNNKPGSQQRLHLQKHMMKLRKQQGDFWALFIIETFIKG